MSKLGIGTGITPDDGNGDSLLEGAVKVNSNFNEIYSYFGDGTDLTSGSWQKVSSGINTTLNVGIGTTNPRFALEVGSVGTSGTSLHVNGNARITGILTVGSSSISLDGSNNILKVGTGVTVYGNTGIVSATSFYASGLQVGVVTASTIIYEGSVLYNAWQETSAGINTLSNVGIGTTNPTSALTVKGNTSLETLSVSGITSTKDLIVYGTGNDSGSISTMALMSRTNYLDFGPAIPNTSAPQSFAIRLGSDRATGTFGPYSILQASWTNPSGSVSLNNWDGTGGISINDTGVFAQTKPVIIGTATSTGTASQTLQVTGGAYVSGSVGIGTTNPTSKLTVKGTSDLENVTVSGVSTLGVTTFIGNVSFGTSAYFGNNDKLIFGDDNDLQIFYDGSSSRIWETGDLGLEIRTNQFFLSSQDGVENIIRTTENSSVELYYDNSKKFETLGTGVTVTGTTFTNELSVSGVSTFNSRVLIPTATAGIVENIQNKLIFGNDLNIFSTSGNNYILADENPLSIGVVVEQPTLESFFGLVDIFPENDLVLGNTSYVSLGFGTEGVKLKTIGTGVTVTGTTFTNQLSVSGVSTFNNTINTEDILSKNISANGHITIKNTGTELRFQDSAGNPASVRVGDDSGGNAYTSDNVFVGYRAGYLGQFSNNAQNIFIGAFAGNDLVTSYGNVIIGRFDGITPELDLSYSPTNTGYIVLANGLGDVRMVVDPDGNTGIGTTNPQGTLQVGTGVTIYGNSGIVSATSFVGDGQNLTNIPAGQLTGALPAIDGSALTGVVGSGSGIEVKDSGVSVGTAGTIDFGSNLSVSSVSAGVVTVTASGGGGDSYWTSTDVGIHTLSNVGIGTTNPYSGHALTVAGITTTNGLYISGITTFRGRLDLGSSTEQPSSSIYYSQPNTIITNNYGSGKIRLSAPSGIEMLSGTGETIAYFADNPSHIGYVALYHNNFKKFETIGIGVTITGYTFTNQLNVSGVSTFGSANDLTVSYFDSINSNFIYSDEHDLLIGTKGETGGSINYVGLVGIHTGNDAYSPNTSYVTLRYGSSETKLQTIGTGVTVTGTTFTDQLSVSGVVTATSFSGSNTLKERTVVTGVTTSIANNGIGNTDITGFKSYALMKVGLSTAGWLRLYTDSASRTADASRSVGIDPSPGSGVIAEVVTTGISTTQIISPFVMGGNLDNPADTTIYAAITNLSGSTQAITANLTILQLEA